MNGKPLDIDGNVMQVGDLVVVVGVPCDHDFKGRYCHVDKLGFDPSSDRQGNEYAPQWLFYSKDCAPCHAGICDTARIIRDTKSKENIDLTEWVGEREGVKS